MAEHYATRLKREKQELINHIADLIGRNGVQSQIETKILYGFIFSTEDAMMEGVSTRKDLTGIEGLIDKTDN